MATYRGEVRNDEGQNLPPLWEGTHERFPELKAAMQLTIGTDQLVKVYEDDSWVEYYIIDSDTGKRVGSAFIAEVTA